ncbi:MAG: D-alanyl-D-alanine carboxypeptidase family protein [Eubacteriales bacterium]|nr:D-alanyl-D-alanine carboxypeptidase family protein [Eubacteriales bacterium]
MKSGNKTQKAERDPYKFLLKVAGILVLVAAISAVVFLLCNAAVQSDYKAKRQEVDQLNAEGEQEFNARLNTLRAAASVTVNPETGEVTAVEPAIWEATLDGLPWRLEDASATALENISTVTVNRSDLLFGGLLLVNPWHSLPTDFSEATLTSIGTGSGWQIAVTDSNVRVFPAALTALENIIAGAKDAGLSDYIVREAYRTNDEQTLLFNSQMEKLSSKYSGDVLIEQTKKSVNYPGTSEYQTGLAFRMALYNKADPAIAKQKFQETTQGQWFTENCWKYGVIFRFPSADYPNANWEDKSYKTGMSLHLDLYRYVGSAHSAAMQIMNYCLEEYVEFLIDHPHLYIYKDGALLYEVYRITAEDASTYDVPVPNPASSYVASLDNMGGIVLAYAYN